MLSKKSVDSSVTFRSTEASLVSFYKHLGILFDDFAMDQSDLAKQLKNPSGKKKPGRPSAYGVRELSEQTGISKGTLNTYMTRANKVGRGEDISELESPDISNVLILANFFKVSLDDLFGHHITNDGDEPSVQPELGLSDDAIRILNFYNANSLNSTIINTLDHLICDLWRMPFSKEQQFKRAQHRQMLEGIYAEHICIPTNRHEVAAFKRDYEHEDNFELNMERMNDGIMFCQNELSIIGLIDLLSHIESTSKTAASLTKDGGIILHPTDVPRTKRFDIPTRPLVQQYLLHMICERLKDFANVDSDSDLTYAEEYNAVTLSELQSE